MADLLSPEDGTEIQEVGRSSTEKLVKSQGDGNLRTTYAVFNNSRNSSGFMRNKSEKQVRYSNQVKVICIEEEEQRSPAFMRRKDGSQNETPLLKQRQGSEPHTMRQDTTPTLRGSNAFQLSPEKRNYGLRGSYSRSINTKSERCTNDDEAYFLANDPDNFDDIGIPLKSESDVSMDY